MGEAEMSRNANNESVVVNETNGMLLTQTSEINNNEVHCQLDYDDTGTPRKENCFETLVLYNDNLMVHAETSEIKNCEAPQQQADVASRTERDVAEMSEEANIVDELPCVVNLMVLENGINYCEVPDHRAAETSCTVNEGAATSEANDENMILFYENVMLTTEEDPLSSDDLPVLLGTPTEANFENVVGVDGHRKKKQPQKRCIRKLFRERGEQYTNYKGKIIPARRVKDGCNVTKCLKKCHINFSLEEREKIHSNYWKLSNIQKREFLLRCITKKAKNRSTTSNHESRRNFTRQYYLPDGEDNELEVCKKFLIFTLDIGEKLLRYTEANCSSLRSAKVDGRGKTTSRNKTPPQSVKTVRNFIEGLPAVPSHYCRSSTSKKYLPQEYESLANITRKYEEYCRENCYQAVSQYVFKNIFTSEYNIGIHSPKKDKCAFCTYYKNLKTKTPEDEEKVRLHEEKNELVYKIYLGEQERARRDINLVTCSFDLQKVLNTPSGDSMLFFYSRKYAVYNLTFYESYTQNGFCYMWGEVDGKRGSNEICTIMERYLMHLDERKVKEVSLFCDNCPGQQKNKTMVILLAHVLQKMVNIKKITLNFLVVGHTMMTVDSIHGVIERATRKKTVYAPSEWSTIITNARQSPFPYQVEKMNFDDWRDWKTFGDKKTIKPSDGSLFKLGSIQKAEFEKRLIQKNKFKVFYNLTEEDLGVFCTIENKRRLRQETIEPVQLYYAKIPLSEKKYRDLVGLCIKGAIPQHLHQQYLDLPHQSNVADILADSDIEDSDIED